MKKFVLALAALSTLAFAAPTLAAAASAAPGVKVVRSDVVKVGHRRGHVVKKVTVRRGHHDSRMHRHGRKVVVVKHHRPHHGKTVVIKHRR
ncbi:MAG: hypothetical protein AB7O60_18635 [Variibacter sp.]